MNVRKMDIAGSSIATSLYISIEFTKFEIYSTQTQKTFAIERSFFCSKHCRIADNITTYIHMSQVSISIYSKCSSVLFSFLCSITEQMPLMFIHDVSLVALN